MNKEARYKFSMQLGIASFPSLLEAPALEKPSGSHWLKFNFML